MKKALKLFFEFLLLVFLLICLVWHKLVIYGLEQGEGQLELVWNARPVEDVLKDPSFPDSLKLKLNLITEIKQYTIDSLGMEPSENYTRVYDQKNQAVLFTVSGCEPFAFKPKEWRFPVLGTVPYVGFFNKEKARKEVLKLKAEGYDVDIYSPSGWSTLGWFRDPILSNMLKQNERSIANLIIHELTHGTLFIKNDVNFNENLANFIGDKGAERFLIMKYGKDSKQHEDYIQNKVDEKIYDDYILKGAERLDSLYKRMMDDEETDLVRKEKKKKMIMEIVVGVNRLPLYKKKNYFNYTLQAFHEGNAFFMSFTRYDSQYDFFESEYKRLYNSDLKKYMIAMKEKYPSIDR
ncbi:MAG TPA: aminopeptidase [Bacteroidia bacterium]|jgi:predicted aminopeptidase